MMRVQRARSRGLAAPFERKAAEDPLQRHALSDPLAGPVVQRKVGFEFEDGRWRAWHQGWFSRIYPAERKAALHADDGYNLEADDTPGPKASNLEFVTEPFEESGAGLARLEATLGRMRTVGDRLDGLVGARGPAQPGADPPYTFEAEHFVSQDQHQLVGPAYGGGRWVHLSRGRAGWSFKMQATAGAALADLPTVMKYFGSEVPGETDEEKGERDPARASLAGDADQAAQSAILKVIGGSPAVAAVAAGRIRGDGRLTADQQELFAPDRCASLEGLLSAVVLTVKMLQLPIDGVLKYRIPLMFRTDFARLFEALPVDQRAVLLGQPGVMADAVVHASNGAPLLPRYQGVDPDTALTTGSPLIRAPRRPLHAPGVALPHEALAGITIGVWMRGFQTGTDLLTPTAVNNWLSRQGWWWYDRRDKVALLESFGTVPNTDRSPGEGGRPLGVFESRAIAPKGSGGDLTMEEASRMAWNQLLFYKRIEDCHREEVPLGAYPDEDVGEGIEG